jgi:hypothetical protein
MLIAEITRMNTTNVHVQVTEFGRIAADLDAITSVADEALWRDAAAVLRERIYVVDGGTVRVRIDWSPLAEQDGAETLHLDCEVLDERARPTRPDAASFVELFLHDAFLVLNLAVPGSMSGSFVTLSGDEFRSSEVTLSARVFEYGARTIDVLPLRDVLRWYDALELGASQIAIGGVAKALFHLLHLARHDEDEATSIVRLGHALAGLDVEFDESFAEVYRTQTNGAAPLFHPMANDALDPRVDELSFEWTEVADRAGSTLVKVLQARIRR